MRRPGTWLFLVLSLLAPAVAHAEPSTALWRERYSVARAHLLAGDFDQAAVELRALAATAADPTDRALASELLGLALQWSHGHAQLTRPSASRPETDERTTDEISVLYLDSVFYGLGTGAWLAVQTEPGSAGGAIMPALGLAGASAGAVALIDHMGGFHYGVPQSAVAGMYIGLEQGLTWTLWNQARTRHADEWSDKVVATVIWGSATAGMVAGGVVGNAVGTTPGRASFVSDAALWGGVLAGLGAGALSPEDDYQDDHALLAAAIGLDVGAIGGALAAGPVSPSVARVRFLDLGAVGGGLLFGGVYFSAADKNTDGRAAMGTIALGLAGGLGVAWFATANMKQDPGPREPASPLSITLHPTLTALPGGMGVGVNGTL